MKPSRTPWYEFNAKATPTSAALKIFGPIGGGYFYDPDAITGKKVAEDLESLDDSVKTIRVFVNSPGGSVYDAVHIANALRRQREEKERVVDIEIEALAASAATIVTSAGDSIRIPRNALMMVHNPWALGIGDAKVMRDLAGVLDKVRNTVIATYRWVSKLSAKKLGELMDATTWMEAEEAIANGLATEIIEPIEAAAALLIGKVPEFLTEDAVPEKYRDRIAAVIDGGRPAMRSEASKEREADMTVTVAVKMKTEPGSREEQAMSDENKATIDAAKAEATKAEKARTASIRAVANQGILAGCDRAELKTLEDAALNGTETPEGFRAKVLDKLSTKSDSTGPKQNADKVEPELVEDERDKRVAGITAALLYRAGVVEAVRAAAKKKPDHPVFAGLQLDPGEFRGLSLMDHAREALERNRSGSGRGKSSMQVAGDFFALHAGQSTSDFSVALENTLNKTLLAYYTIAPDTWRRFCKIGSVSDFRPHPRYKRGFLSRLDKVLEDGAFTNKNVPDAVKEVQQAATFGNILALTRQTLINDDMGVFEDLAATLGRAAALSIDLEVYDTLKLNSGLGPTMNDGVTLFHATHANIGTGAALSFASVEADSVLMATQTDPSGNEVLDLLPSVMVLAIGLRGLALQINEAQFEDYQGGKPNRVLGLFADVVGTARLSGTRRYTFADPSIAPTLEVAFLEGEQEPFMDMQDGWRVDGVEWKVRHDFGVAAIDHRGAVTNAGV